MVEGFDYRMRYCRKSFKILMSSKEIMHYLFFKWLPKVV